MTIFFYVGKSMIATKINKGNIGKPTKEITGQNLTDGLAMTEGNFRAHTSFVNLLHKLWQFDDIKFSCLTSTGASYNINNRVYRATSANDLRYFTGEGNERPAIEDWFYGRSHIYGGNDFAVSDTLQTTSGKMSSANVTVEERLYKDIIVDFNGYMTFTEDSKQCLSTEGDWKEFALYIGK